MRRRAPSGSKWDIASDMAALSSQGATVFRGITNMEGGRRVGKSCEFGKTPKTE
jgi:hypothetical protein